MNILAFTDIHSSAKALKEIERKSKQADVLVDAGDISIFERNLDKSLRFLNKLNKPVFIIHGNHEDEKIMHLISEPLKNIYFIHKKAVQYKDVLFIGFGGGGFSSADKRLEKFTNSNLINNIKKKNKPIVFLCHAPPHNTKQDLLFDNEHCGNKSVNKFIKSIKPKLVITGHIHENFNTIDKIYKTAIVNPGPYGRLLKV